MNETVKDKNAIKKPKKGLKIALIIISAVLTMAIITGIFIFLMINSIFGGIIKDTNGPDDYSLATITEEEIAKATGSDYSSIITSQSNEGERSNVDDFAVEDVDYDHTSYAAFSFNGIMIAHATNTEDFKLVLNIISTVSSGNCRIYVYVEDKLYQEVEINKDVFVTINDVANKNVYVKVAGEDAKMSIDVYRD